MPKVTRLSRKGRMRALDLEGEIWLPSPTWTPREFNRSVTPWAGASRAPGVRASSWGDYTWTARSSAPRSEHTYRPGRTQAAGCGKWPRRGTLCLILDPTRAPGPRPPGSQALSLIWTFPECCRTRTVLPPRVWGLAGSGAPAGGMSALAVGGRNLRQLIRGLPDDHDVLAEGLVSEKIGGNKI